MEMKVDKKKKKFKGI